MITDSDTADFYLDLMKPTELKAQVSSRIEQIDSDPSIRIENSILRVKSGNIVEYKVIKKV